MPSYSVNTRYTIGMAVWMVLYAGALVGSITLLKNLQPTGPLLYFLAVLPALPIGGTIWHVQRHIELVDEYVRGMLTKRFIYATGMTLFICTAYGFLESNAGLPHFSLYLVYPLFWGMFGLISAILGVVEKNA